MSGVAPSQSKHGFHALEHNVYVHNDGAQQMRWVAWVLLSAEEHGMA